MLLAGANVYVLKTGRLKPLIDALDHGAPRPRRKSSRSKGSNVLTGSALEMTDELRGLLGQLAGIETQERSVLAEVIHDEPIQLIVAAILRIDLLHAHSTGTDAVTIGRDRHAARIVGGPAPAAHRGA